MKTQSVLDTEYLTYPQQVLVAGLPVNPTADVVQFAFMPNPANANPGVGDWHTGSWFTTVNGGYQAQILVGPANGGVPLAAGLYNVWVKVVDNPQVPVIQVDLLQVV